MKLATIGCVLGVLLIAFGFHRTGAALLLGGFIGAVIVRLNEHPR